ncbi:response regulator transcription factor [Phycicoccus duodecadis]|uniref:Two-component system OmpR family response regulator n=1 Tax=Phycicoccus duodecadis TaxID=173053 RepID=A0A2N3YF54_9MICO|nr:response regulator transcription factor [Phycicoccus duodecadis]PKW25471.1 two-component system OmpR family response regulator [Phycicoccus duodecadis]
MSLVLLADDDAQLRMLVARALTGAGHQVVAVADGAQAREQLQHGGFDLALLDLVMPGESGMSLVKSFTPEQRPTVLLMSGMTDVGPRIEALNAGAVDFVVKPFVMAELVARVNRHLAQKVQATLVDGGIPAGPVVLHPAGRFVQTPDGRVDLSELEFSLLAYLARRAGEACSKEELLTDVWRTEWASSTNLVEVCVARIRHRLGPHFPVRTVRGRGYCIDA